MVLGGFLWFLVVFAGLGAFGGFGGSWWFLVILSVSWRFLVDLGGLGGSWRFLCFFVVIDGCWWLLVVFGGSLW